MKTLAIFGAGGLGIEILEIARIVNQASTFDIWSRYLFVNNGEECDDIDGIKVMGLDKALELYPGDLEAVIATGEPTLREKIAKDLIKNNIPGATIIHPSVHIPRSCSIGQGVCIFPGAYISTNTTIKDNVLISVNDVIGHDVVIENNAALSVSCIVGGMVHIGENAYIGPGAIIKESVNIGKYSVAASGSVVFRDIEDGDLVIGNPARPSKRSNDKLFGN